MAKADQHRGIVGMSMMTERGWDVSTAMRVAFALHPLDDPGSHEVAGMLSSVPGRAFEKSVRKRSRLFAKANRAVVSESVAFELATGALDEYARLATESGDHYYEARVAEMVVLTDPATPRDTEQGVASSPQRQRAPEIPGARKQSKDARPLLPLLGDEITVVDDGARVSGRIVGIVETNSPPDVAVRIDSGDTWFCRGADLEWGDRQWIAKRHRPI